MAVGRCSGERLESAGDEVGSEGLPTLKLPKLGPGDSSRA